jgi:SPP1 family predicted phage head-tail adaptor
MAAPRAGSLNRRITIQGRSTSQDTAGQQSLTWTDVATIWAAVRPLTGHELARAQMVNTEVSHEVTIRYDAQWADPLVMGGRRIAYGSRILNIHASMDEEETHHTITLLCSEGLDKG